MPKFHLFGTQSTSSLANVILDSESDASHPGEDTRSIYWSQAESRSALAAPASLTLSTVMVKVWPADAA
jgi:hypothetical protein